MNKILFDIVAILLLIPPILMATEIKNEPAWMFGIIFWFIPIYPFILYILERMLK